MIVVGDPIPAYCSSCTIKCAFCLTILLHARTGSRAVRERRSEVVLSGGEFCEKSDLRSICEVCVMLSKLGNA